MESKKGNAANIALDNSEHGLTMTNLRPNQTKTQYELRSELLEQSKLARFPQRRAFTLPDFDNTPSKTSGSASCAGCGAKIDLDDSIQKRFSGCRKCISIYGRLSVAVEEAEKGKRNKLLEKFAMEVER